MRIKSVHTKNLRSIRDAHLSLEPLTALIGGNNAGKSTIFKAIELFFESAPKISREDFTKGFEEEAIEITIEFSDLVPEEVTEFGSAVISDKLSVTRHFSLVDSDSGQYSVQALTNPAFEEVRNESNGNARRKIYRDLAAEIDGLPEIGSHTEIEAALTAWESANAEQCELKRVRGFFGATNVANGKLKKKTNVHVVPAVRDASEDASDNRKSPIISLLADISKQTFENKKELASFIEETQKKFAELADPQSIPELGGISELLTESIQQFYADSRLEANWIPGDGVSVSYPSPKIIIDHSGTTTELSRVGHGLQRAALFSIVQFLAERQSANIEKETGEGFKVAASDIIVLVEEPEIYQHPSKQIVIHEAFRKIVEGFNTSTGIRVQIVYSTHSEKFIRMTDFESARIIRRDMVEGEIQNNVSGLTISECSAAFAAFHEPPKEPMSDEAFITKLHIFTREICEGFFAEKIVLVEGITDKAVLEAYYTSIDRDVYRESISIISVDGKTKMDKPAFIFRNLKIPTYLVFDNDKNKKEKEKKPKANILLQKIIGIGEPDEWPYGVHNDFAAMPNDLESYMRSVLEDKYEEIFGSVAEEYGLDFNEIRKTPGAVVEVLNRAKASGFEFPIFDEIIAKIDALEVVD